MILECDFARRAFRHDSGDFYELDMILKVSGAAAARSPGVFRIMSKGLS